MTRRAATPALVLGQLEQLEVLRLALVRWKGLRNERDSTAVEETYLELLAGVTVVPHALAAAAEELVARGALRLLLAVLVEHQPRRALLVGAEISGCESRSWR